MSAPNSTSTHRYYGLSGIALDFESVDLGHNVTLSRTYLHVMAHPMLAFSPAPDRGHHPAPWQALKAKPSAVSVDLHAQLAVPKFGDDSMGHHDRAGWIVMLMRFSLDSTVTLTVEAEAPFDQVAAGKATARMLEPIPDLFEGTTIHQEEARWIKDNWYKSLSLSENVSFKFATTALYHSHCFSEELGVVSVWGALERLLSSNSAELKYRVCTNIAAFLEPPGQERYLMFKELLKLYDDRSAAAHGSPMKGDAPYMDSTHIASRVLLRIIELNRVPSKDDLESELLAPSLPPPSYA
jgi:hypothetical protein